MQALGQITALCQKLGQERPPQPPTPPPAPQNIVQNTLSEVYTQAAPARTRARDDHTLWEAKERLEEVMKESLAERTISTRGGLWKRLESWCVTADLSLPPSEDAAVLFLAGMTHLTTSTVKNYASAINAVGLQQGNWSPLPLQGYANALARATPFSPPKQAVPAKKAEVTQAVFVLFTRGHEVEANLLLFLWKTACRYRDAADLTVKDVKPTVKDVKPTACGTRLVVDFYRSKAIKTTPFVDRRFAVAAGAGLERLIAFVVEKRQTCPLESLLFGVPHSQFLRLLRQCPNCQEWTLHSPRRGALQFLATLAANGILPPRTSPGLPGTKPRTPFFPPPP